MKNEKFKNRKCVVFGMGNSGVSAFRLLHALGGEVYAISQGEVDSWPCFEQLMSLTSRNYLVCQDEVNQSLIEGVEFVVISPGIPRDLPIFKFFQGIPVISEIELGVRALDLDGPTYIGVTGTNGKTTTVSFLGEMIKDLNKEVFVGGNIGIPLCDYAYQRLFQKRASVDYILLELSSFQLEASPSFHPKVSGILNVTPNHGERYLSENDYKQAKFNLFNNVTKTDTVILNAKLKTNFSSGAKIVYVEENSEFNYPYSLENFKLVGEHNLFNLKFCLEVLKGLDLMLPEVQRTIDHFSGVAHRLQYVESEDAFTLYNDAKSTNWEATITALKAFEGQRGLYLILGGKKRGRGDSISPYIETISNYVEKIMLIGETENDLGLELEGYIPYEKCGNLNTVFLRLRADEFKGTVLFSPAFPSFDQFKNYMERGESFISEAQKPSIR